jgi:hypothetical protein
MGFWVGMVSSNSNCFWNNLKVYKHGSAKLVYEREERVPAKMFKLLQTSKELNVETTYLLRRVPSLKQILLSSSALHYHHIRPGNGFSVLPNPFKSFFSGDLPQGR